MSFNKLAEVGAALAAAVILAPVAPANPGDPNGDQNFFSRIDGKVSGTSDQWIPLAHWACEQLQAGRSLEWVTSTAEQENPQSSAHDITMVIGAGHAAYCPGV